MTAGCAILAELSGGAYHVEPITEADLISAAKIIERHKDQGIGLADASLVVLADRYRTKSILTLDLRHFEVVRPLSGGRFRILPSTAGDRSAKPQQGLPKTLASLRWVES